MENNTGGRPLRDDKKAAWLPFAPLDGSAIILESAVDICVENSTGGLSAGAEGLGAWLETLLAESKLGTPGTSPLCVPAAGAGGTVLEIVVVIPLLPVVMGVAAAVGAAAGARIPAAAAPIPAPLADAGRAVAASVTARAVVRLPLVLALAGALALALRNSLGPVLVGIELLESDFGGLMAETEAAGCAVGMSTGCSVGQRRAI